MWIENSAIFRVAIRRVAPRSKMMIHIFILVSSLLILSYGQNLLKNSDFESGLTGWDCFGFKCEVVQDAQSGHNAIKASSRTQYYQGPSQILDGLKQNTKYKASAYVKMLSDRSGGQKIDMEVAFTFSDSSKQFVTISSNTGLTIKAGYIQLKGEFTTPSQVFTETVLSVQGPLPGQEFEVDSTSLLLAPKTGDKFLVNPDFESGLIGWSCKGFKCDVVTDANNGTKALKVSNRSKSYHGPSQDIKGLQPNSQYEIGSYVKMATDLPGDVIGQIIYVELVFHFADGTKSDMDVAGRSMVLKKDGYVKIHGDFPTPAKAFLSARMNFQGPDPGIDFIVDSVFIKQIPDYTNWRAESDHVIKTQRQNIISVSVDAGSLDINKVNIQINQTKKSFPFGTAVACGEYVNGDKRYSDFIHKHFNWAVTENALKWDFMVPSPGVMNDQLPINALKKLKANGLKIRAHNIIWSKPRFIQGWLKALNPDQLKTAVSNRIQWVINDTKQYVEHWDVNNENLHGQFFQRAVHDRDYNLQIFREVHKAGPNIKLFLNDYSVVTTGSFTGPYLKQALKFKNSNTGVYGIGVQCHFASEVSPNPTLIKAHLDTLSQAGLPIWVTELDVVSQDEKVRADFYETALRALYGHPAVEGILFWGFWSKHQARGEGTVMVTGDEFRLNLAGKRVLDLFEKEWMTHTAVNVGKAGNRFTVSGFHGDYNLTVFYDGKERPDLKQTFSVEKQGIGTYLNIKL